MNERDRQIQLKQSAGMTLGEAIDAVDYDETRIERLADKILDLESDDEVRGILNAIGLVDEDVNNLWSQHVMEALDNHPELVDAIEKQVNRS